MEGKDGNKGHSQLGHKGYQNPWTAKRRNAELKEMEIRYMVTRVALSKASLLQSGIKTRAPCPDCCCKPLEFFLATW